MCIVNPPCPLYWCLRGFFLDGCGQNISKYINIFQNHAPKREPKFGRGSAIAGAIHCLFLLFSGFNPLKVWTPLTQLSLGSSVCFFRILDDLCELSFIWVNYNDLTVLPHWNHGLFQGNHPQMALIQVSEIL